MSDIKRVVVTGGAGFIGTNLVLSALRKGIRVTIFDNLSRRGTELNLEKIKAFASENGSELNFVKGDLRSFEEVKSMAERNRDTDAVFHLAGQVAVTSSIENPREDFEINLLGTFNLLESMRKYEIRCPLLYSCTNKVYGGMENVNIIEEETRYDYSDYPNGIPEDFGIDFHSPYGCSKGAAEQYVMDYGRIFGLSPIVFRQSCIYGKHQFGIEDQGWVAWFVISALQGREIKIYGDGKQVRDILYIDDLIDAYWKAVESSAGTDTERRVYNIGGGSECRVSLLELVEILGKKLGFDIPVSFHQPRPGDQKVFFCDCSKAAAELGWVPATGVEKGVEKLVDWINSNRKIFVKAGIMN